MVVARRTRAKVSAIGSGFLTLVVVLLGNGGAVTSEWIFPGLLMLLSGWAVIYNLLSFGVGRQAEAFTVNYLNDGKEPDRPMSPRLTTMVLAVFWITGAALLVEAGFSVLLIEAGSDHRCPYYHVPIMQARASEDAEMRGDFFVRHYADDARQWRDDKFVPERDGVLYPRGATLGGSIAIGALFRRGCEASSGVPGQTYKPRARHSAVL